MRSRRPRLHVQHILKKKKGGQHTERGVSSGRSSPDLAFMERMHAGTRSVYAAPATCRACYTHTIQLDRLRIPVLNSAYVLEKKMSTGKRQSWGVLRFALGSVSRSLSILKCRFSQYSLLARLSIDHVHSCWKLWLVITCQKVL